MTDFFKSAFNYIGGANISQENDFVGQLVELGNQKLRVKKVIAEGTRYLSFLVTLSFVFFS